MIVSDAGRLEQGLAHIGLQAQLLQGKLLIAHLYILADQAECLRPDLMHSCLRGYLLLLNALLGRIFALVKKIVKVKDASQ